MKVGLLLDGDITGTTPERRYHELIEEAIFADELGFYSWGTSEQHFSAPRLTVSFPDAMYGAVAVQTKQIKIRYMAIIMLTFNHPIQVAERLGMLDIVSKGRVELCTARGNYKPTMDSFGVPPIDTRAIWAESVEALVTILTQDTFEYHGDVWDIPPTTNLQPRTLQKPHPPLYVVGSSPPSQKVAAERGLGTMCFDNYFGWDFLQGCIDAYKDNIGAPSNPITSVVNDCFSVYIPTAHCHEDREQAKKEATEQCFNWLDFIANMMYKPLRNEPTYEYFSQIDEIEEAARTKDMDYLMERTPAIMVGTPDDLIERFKRLEAQGVDEALIRVDGFGHVQHMKSLELMGKYVLPEIQKPSDTDLSRQIRPLAAATATAE